MGHPKWFLIDNKVSNFNEKINRAKEAVHQILGTDLGVNFYKKFLLKKEKNKSTEVWSIVPVDFSEIDDYEET